MAVKNLEQEWLENNLARFSQLMQGHRTLDSVASWIMSELPPLVEAHQGAFFIAGSEDGHTVLNRIACYAYQDKYRISTQLRLKEGLVGQCAFEKKRILIQSPDSSSIRISPQRVEVTPQNIVAVPILEQGELKAVIELASLNPFSSSSILFLDQLADVIGVNLNLISSSTQSHNLLRELQRSNRELEAQTKELEDKARLLEVKNHEVEMADCSLEKKAEQRSLISQYQYEFLAHMSHDLRRPLNSLLHQLNEISDLSEFASKKMQTSPNGKSVEIDEQSMTATNYGWLMEEKNADEVG